MPLLVLMAPVRLLVLSEKQAQQTALSGVTVTTCPEMKH